MAALATLAGPNQYRETIKKSVFQVHAAPVRDAGEAMRFIAEHSDPAATHNCWAYRVGAAYRFNDDGEPGGTAGRPILQAIEGQGCDRVAVVVIRWYGGIKLGPGGLMRAYGGSAANCLRLAERLEIVDSVTVTCVCVFADLQWVKSRIAHAGATVIQERYGATDAALTLEVPRVALAALGMAVANATRGQAGWQVRDEA